MAAETTRTSLTEIVNSEAIAEVIMDYAADKIVIYPLVRVMNLAGRATATASFPAWEKDAGEDVTTEGTTALTNVELQTTEISAITAAQVGILREVTDFAAAVNILGEGGLAQFIVQDGTYLCMEMLEDDLASLFASASNSVGTTGSDMTVANFVEAMAKLDTAKARGEKVCILDDQQASDLRLAVAASGSTVFGNAGQTAQTILNSRSDAYVGELFGARIWLTNLTDTANTNADVVGSMFINAQSNPACTPYGVALLWDPRLKSLNLPDQIATQYATTMAYGVGEILDYAHVKIVTDA
jgi:hypothetical protein